MTLASQMDADVAGLFLQVDDFGETVQRIRADNLTVQSLTALIVWETAEEQRTNGRGAKLQGVIHVASDSTISLSDRWLINDHYFATVAVGEPEYGLQPISISRMSKDLQTGSRGVI